MGNSFGDKILLFTPSSKLYLTDFHAADISDLQTDFHSIDFFADWSLLWSVFMYEAWQVTLPSILFWTIEPI